MLSFVVAALFLAALPLAAQTGTWTAVGSTGVVDESAAAIYAFGITNLTYLANSTTPIVARYNVTNTWGASDTPPWKTLKMGYLDTGADDIVFPDAPKVTLYASWEYVLVEAGPEQAATWRQSDDRSFWKGALPSLMFPADHSWLVSTLWDDDWTCIGGPAGLVGRFLRNPKLQARPVGLGQDATPPGHQAL
jgi:hypothetical protein